MRSGMKARLGLPISQIAWNNFRLDFSATLLFSLFNVVFNQFYLPMAIRQGASDLEIGLLSASPAIGLLFSPLWTGGIERFGPRRFFFIPNLIGRLLIIFPALFGAPVVYVATALVFQLLMGMQSPAYASLLTRLYPARQRGKLLGYVRVGMCLLMMPMAFLIGNWIDYAGPRPALISAALTGALSLWIFRGVRNEDGSDDSPTPAAAAPQSSWSDRFALLVGNRELLVFFLATTFSGFGNILSSPLYQMIQVKELNLSNTQIGTARVVYYAFLLLSYFVSGWALDRYPPKRTLVYGLGAVIVVPLLYGLSPSFGSVLVASGIQGIADAIWDIGVLAFVFMIAPGREASIFSIHLMLFGIRGTIGPLLSTGLVRTVPYSDILMGASFCGLVGTALFLFLLKDRKKRKPDRAPDKAVTPSG
ncbi:MFS transporter [Gorillibacterium timonense]|uniref:MFS transporter n=1 Tax=Gorillibacterium timonense TaxID=1689269 RepID=UPI000A7A810F|nr:MFS transporter [Gorillibacterium timonense]